VLEFLEAVRLWFNSRLGGLSPSQWEAWRNWLSTIGGLVALCIALITYRRNVKTKNEEQPRKVYSELVQVKDGIVGGLITHTPGLILHPDVAVWGQGNIGSNRALPENPWRTYSFRVTNGSDEIIDPVHFVAQYNYTDKTTRYSKRVYGVLKPGEAESVQIAVPGSSSDKPRLCYMVTFRDSGGRWWRRKGTQAIEKAKPLDTGNEPSTFARINARARERKHEERRRLEPPR
jgi:hypothetical protein